MVIVGIVAFGGWRVYEYFNDGDTPTTSTTTGEPGAGFLVPSTDRLDFGVTPADEPPQETLQLTNDGPGPLDINSVGFAEGVFFRTEDNCGRLDPFDSCEVRVFADLFEPGEHFDVIVIDHTGSNPTLEIGVVAATGPEIALGTDLVGRAIDFISNPEPILLGQSSFWAMAINVEISNLGPETARGEFALWFEWLNPDSGEFQWIPSEPPLVSEAVPGLGSIIAGHLVQLDAELLDIGQVARLRVLIDSCLGEEFIADPPCRVEESNENNNMSEPFDVVIGLSGEIE